MSETALPPPLPPAPPRRWPWVLAIVLVMAAAIVALTWRPFPTDEERKYFGWWYGWERTDDRNARAWIAELREDGQVRIQFARYSQQMPGAGWQTYFNAEIGTWRVRNGTQEFATEDPEHPIGLAAKIQRFQETGHWRREHFYRTQEIAEREMRYQEVTQGKVYHSLHSMSPVTFPAEPLPPEHWPTTAGLSATKQPLR
jgi:hypothetical protein